MESKKIILFIVEGISEENALGPILDKSQIARSSLK